MRIVSSEFEKIAFSISRLLSVIFKPKRILNPDKIRKSINTLYDINNEVLGAGLDNGFYLNQDDDNQKYAAFKPNMNTLKGKRPISTPRPSQRQTALTPIQDVGASRALDSAVTKMQQPVAKARTVMRKAPVQLRPGSSTDATFKNVIKSEDKQYREVQKKKPWNRNTPMRTGY